MSNFNSANLAASSEVPIGVGLDTARYGHHVTFLDDKKKHATKPFHFREGRDGYQKLVRAFDRLSERYPDAVFHIRFDAGGQYATNLLEFVHRLEVNKTVSVGEPARNKAYRQAHFPNRKADPVESLACARFAVVERPEETPRVPVEFAELRDTAARLEANAKQQTRLLNQLHNQLARVFPELAVLYRDLNQLWLLKLLLDCPTPARILQAPVEQLTALPYVTEAKVTRIREAARCTTGAFDGDVSAELVSQLASQVLDCRQNGARLKEILEKAWKALPDGPHQFVAAIPGIGVYTAACLVAKVVSIDRFPTPHKLVGYFGVFPEERNVSGTDRHGNPKTGPEKRMSAKGNDLVRRNLYMAACSAITCNPAVRKLYARLMKGGTGSRVALGHCMAKLLRQAWAVWAKAEPFDPSFESSATDQQEGTAAGPSGDDTDRTNACETAGGQQTPAEVEASGCAQSAADQACEDQQTAAGRKGGNPNRKAVTATASNVEPVDQTVKPAHCDADADPCSGEQRPKSGQATSETPPNSRPAIDFRAIREQVTIQQVLDHLDWSRRLRAKGPQKRGPCPCPQHAEQSPKSQVFSVNGDRQIFRCFECGASGNVVDFWAAVHGLEPYDAAWELAHTFLLNEHTFLLNEKAPRDRSRGRTANQPPGSHWNP